MKTTVTLILTAALALLACGDDSDPSKNSSTSNVSTNNTTANNTTANNTSTNNTTPNNTTPNNTTPNNTTPNNTTPNNTTPCEPDASFYGQIGDTEGDHGGGAPTETPLDFDAGLQAVLDAMPAQSDDPETEGVDEGAADVSLQVTGAMVTATSFNGNERFWVQDQNAAIQAFLPRDFDPGFTVRVGMRVSFEVTRVVNFGGTPQISTVSGMTMDSEGNEVPVLDRTGEAITPEDYARVVKVGGRLSASGEACGGSSTCYQLTHGEVTSVFRTNSDFIEGGECVTFVGPVSAFPGPIGGNLTDGDMQLDQINYDWAWTAF